MEQDFRSSSTSTSTGMSGLSPKLSFIFGVISAIAVFSTIGFLVMLKGGSADSSGGSAQAGTVQGATDEDDGQAVVVDPNPTAAAPTPSAPAGASSLALADVENIRGKGKFTIVEFSDFECPFCKRFHPTLQQIVKDFDGQVAWGYEHFPIDSLHSKARRESQASECAAEQGKFWEYADKIFEKTPSNNGLPDEDLFTIADELKLNRSTFDSCLESGKTATKVNEDTTLSSTMGAQGTPFSVIVDEGGKVVDTISGALPVEQIKAKIQKLL